MSGAIMVHTEFCQYNASQNLRMPFANLATMFNSGDNLYVGYGNHTSYFVYFIRTTIHSLTQ